MEESVVKESQKDLKRQSNHKLRGTVAAIISAVLFGCEPMAALIAYAHGNNAVAFIFYATAMAVAALFILLKLMHVPILPTRKQLVPLLVSGFFASVTTMLLFESYNYISSGIATTLHFTYPTIVAIGGVVLFKQKLTIYKVLALVLSLAGIVCVADLSGSFSLMGVLIALISGVTYSTYIMVMDQSEIKHIHYLKLSFYMAVVKLFVTFAFGLMRHSLVIPVEGMSILMMILFAIGISIGAVTLFQIGVRDTGGSDAAIFSMFEPITSIIVGVTVFREVLTGWKLLGCLLILTGILLTALSGRNKN